MAGNRLNDENGKTVVPISESDPYSWVKGEVRDMVSLFRDSESIEELGETSSWVRKGESVKVMFLPCIEDDRVFHRSVGLESFFMYVTVFVEIGIRFPFTQFECGVLSQLKCAPSQIHPNGWAFIRGFEILMEYVGAEPLLEVFFTFFQAKGVRKGGLVTLNSEKSARVISFLEQCVLTKEALSLAILLKWEKEREYVERYLETTTGGLKNFFKCRAERGHSASNVIKTEEGVVVNQPAEKKKVPSMKRRRAGEGGSGKKVIDLTTSRCCGKEVSLDQVRAFTKNQRRLHGYVGEEDLTSVWSEHFPMSVLAEEHFQSKTDVDLIDSVDDVTRAQFMQVCAAQLLCVGRYEELMAREEAEQKKEKATEVQKSLEMERKFQAASEQITAKDKELSDLKSSVEQLKGKLQKMDKEKTKLEARVVELCIQKKEAETSKEDHGYDMMAAGFERAHKQAEFLFPDIKFDKLDPIKVVHNGALVDDDEVDLEGGGDHDPEE
ncbi:hypothetical protein PIB30_039852 [Stylosanthes scabra]|uniref:Transposase (putative) gypsy type domain-containing protein n=1 Tax=Stylosanthes scabra TaxID=79078 RepID=A0ABU6UDR8_9FABA|nr:hypothetical protein [Stylosanthes scabra]